MLSNLHIPLVPFILVLLSACSGPQVKEFDDSASASMEVKRLSGDLVTAVEQQVDVLSPKHFQEAYTFLRTAVDFQQKAKPSREVLHQVALGRDQLDRALSHAVVSRSALEGVTAARLAANAAGAKSSLGPELEKIDNHLKQLTVDIETKDQAQVAAQQKSLQASYLGLELQAIILANLSPTRAVILEAEREGAAKFAPESLVIAKKTEADAESFIVGNRHEKALIEERTAKALSESEHLLQTTRASKLGRKNTSEQGALLLESERNKRIGVSNILNAENELNRQLEAARREFEPNEAEVFRKNNQIVIRLRALEFPTNQSVVRESGQRLLAKVAEVMGELKNSTAVIEGHTDSVGSPEWNQPLSLQRSQAVGSYLVSAGAINRSNIREVGYGARRPLVSNSTPSGRLTNRRVEIIIGQGFPKT